MNQGTLQSSLLQAHSDDCKSPAQSTVWLLQVQPNLRLYRMSLDLTTASPSQLKLGIYRMYRHYSKFPVKVSVLQKSCYNKSLAKPGVIQNAYYSKSAAKPAVIQNAYYSKSAAKQRVIKECLLHMTKLYG